MTSTDHEEKVFQRVLLMAATPALLAGFMVGLNKDEPGLMVGCVLVSFILLYACREAVSTFRKRD